MTSAPPKLHADMTMADILDAFPGAQRALFQAFHIGGCSSCGFQPEDTLREVLKKHDVDDADKALDVINQFAETDRKMQVQPEEVAALMKGKDKPRLIDVRTEQEYDIAKIEGSELLDQELFEKLRTLPPDTPIVFHCHHGMRSLDVAAYFAGHGFSNVRSMTGGIDAWSAKVDPRVPQY